MGLRIELAEGVWVSHGACRWTAARAGGPGGQHVNTTESKVILHLPLAALQGLTEGARERLRRLLGGRLNEADELVLQAGIERSQARNRALVLRRLRQLIEQACIEPRRRRRTRPTRASVERRLQGKRQQADKKRHRRSPDKD